MSFELLAKISFLFLLGMAVVSIIYLTVDGLFIIPLADKNANDFCILNGFDQYKSYSRYGFFSEEPIGVKCEYAEKYTDLGVRNN